MAHSHAMRFVRTAFREKKIVVPFYGGGMSPPNSG
jgi:hypothetical protein